MKKLGVVAALALVTTVGGVYAAWNYKGTPAAEVTENLKNGINITDAHISGVYGTIDVVSDTLALVIDNAGNYVPGWKDNSANGGELSIVYETYEGAPDTIELEYTITIKNNTYDPDGAGPNAAVPILNVVADGASGETVLTGSVTVNNTDVGTYTAITWTYDDIVKLSDADATGWFAVNNTFDVPTYEAYVEYSAAVKNIEVSVSVVDKTAATTVAP